jgi:competence protein ComEA
VLDGQEERETNVRVFTIAVMLAGLTVPALADDYKSLPDGPGRDVTVRVCAQCHSPEVVAQQSLDAAGWKALVDQMANNGAQASDAEFDTITKYLAASFPPK